MRAPLHAFAALAFLALSAPAGALEPSAFFDGASALNGADRDVAVRAGTVVRQATEVAQPSPAIRVMQAEPPLDGPPKPAPKKEGGFMDGVKSFLNWDNRSLPAFAVGMGIGLGIAAFSGLFFTNPLLGIAGAIFVGLVIGFMLNAFKGP